MGAVFICVFVNMNFVITKVQNITKYVTCLEKVSEMDIFGGVFGVFGVCEVFRNRTKHRSIVPTFPPTFNAV